MISPKMRIFLYMLSPMGPFYLKDNIVVNVFFNFSLIAINVF